MPELNDTQTEQVTEPPAFQTEVTPELEVTQPVVEDAPEVTIDDFRGQRAVMVDTPVEKEETNLDKTQEELEKEVQISNDKVTEEVETAPNAQASAEPSIYDAYPAAKLLSKKMANDARQFLEARLTELETIKKQNLEAQNALQMARQGRTQVPDSYYENAHAYVLLPEYQAAQANAQLAQKIAQHWRAQKARVAGGQDWYDIQEVRDAQGRLVDVKPSAEAIKLDADGQVTVDEQYMHTVQQYNSLVQQSQYIAQNFRQNVNERLGAIRKAEADIFAGDNWAKKDTLEYKTAEQVADGIKKLGISEANPAFGLLEKDRCCLSHAARCVCQASATTESEDYCAAEATRGWPHY